MSKIWAAAGLIALAVSACSARGGNTVNLDEYSLEPDRQSARAGQITFVARNAGEIPHQFLVLKTELDAEDLPQRKGVVPIGRDGIPSLGGIERVAPDDAEDLTVDLEAGDYVLICNIPGHYENGMRAPFRVT